MFRKSHLLIGGFICFFLVQFCELKSQTKPYYPSAITTVKNKLYLAQKGTESIEEYSKKELKLLRSFQLETVPTGVVINDTVAYVTTFSNEGAVVVLNLTSGQIVGKIPTSSVPCSPVLSSDKKTLYVCNQFANTVLEINLSTNKIQRTVSVLREPKVATLSKDGKSLYVANFLPSQKANEEYVSSAVSIINLKKFKKTKDLLLANGSNALRGICRSCSSDYIYITHNLGRYTVPTSQLQQGWMNTSALSILDSKKQEYVGTILLDEPDKGAAGTWDVVCNKKQLFISHSGTHDISVIDETEMLKKLGTYSDKSKLSYDLHFLYGLRKRVKIVGNGPREMVLGSNNLFVTTYFSDIINVFNLSTQSFSSSYPINPLRKECKRDKGEKYFNDASNCFQGWQSCNGCHPGEGRTDGLNWDLLNDGIGNPKNCKSLLFTHFTPPSMITGIRESAEIAVRAGFKYIQFYNATEEKASCVDEYLKTLKPVPSPYLVAGNLSKKAQKGKALFEKLQCATCHYGPYFSDGKKHRIGADVEFKEGWNTPTLKEVWRTAPYLFDGRAATLYDVFKKHKHGIQQKVSKKEIEALTEYVNSL